MNDITGRDEYIETQALVYAIACIQSLPKRRQERSNMGDMCRIARATINPTYLAVLVQSVEAHMNMSIDLFPNEELTPADVEFKLDYDFEVTKMREHQAEAIKAGMADVQRRFGLKAKSKASSKEIADAAISRAQSGTIH